MSSVLNASDPGGRALQRLAAACLALAVSGLLLPLAGCGGARDVRGATSSFGDAIGRFKGGPIEAAIAAYGEPTRRAGRSDGGTDLVWKREGTVFRRWALVPQDCTLTMLADVDGKVASVVAGGNSLYCADEFSP